MLRMVDNGHQTHPDRRNPKKEKGYFINFIHSFIILSRNKSLTFSGFDHLMVLLYGSFGQQLGVWSYMWQISLVGTFLLGKKIKRKLLISWAWSRSGLPKKEKKICRVCSCSL
jgi:hypothetical protein